MAVKKIYPQREYRQVSPSTSLSCAGCHRAIRRLEKCLASDQGLYYHVGCQLKDSPEAKGGVGPSAASGEGGEGG